jgi:trigger factor
VVRQELLNIVAEDVYSDALEQAEIVPFAPGTLEKTEFDPLILRFTVPLPPQVDLPDLVHYRREFSGVEVSEEQLSDVLEAIRQENAVLAPIDRPASEGDLIVAELVGRAADGEIFLHEEGARILLDPEAEGPVPGLLDGLLGLREGEERSFSLVLPEDAQPEELQGEEAEFTVDVASVYERFLPELDDDLARTVGNYDTFDELKANVRRRLQESQLTELEEQYAEQVLQHIIDQAEVSYPPVLLDDALSDAVENYRAHIERREPMMLEDYLRIQGKTMEDLREELRPGVEESLKRSLVLSEVVEREGLEVSDEEIEAQIAESTERLGDRADEIRAALNDSDRLRDLVSRMLANKAVERLVAIAKGEVAEPADAEEDATLTEEQVESQAQPEQEGS